MQTYTVLGKDYYMKVEADRERRKFINYLIKTPRSEYAEYLADRVSDCLLVGIDDAIQICIDLGFDHDFLCDGFDGSRIRNPILLESSDKTAEA